MSTVFFFLQRFILCLNAFDRGNVTLVLLLCVDRICDIEPFSIESLGGVCFYIRTHCHTNMIANKKTIYDFCGIT
jgi:hypothetical protein